MVFVHWYHWPYCLTGKQEEHHHCLPAVVSSEMETTWYRSSVGHLTWISFCILISTGFGWRLERLDNIERGQHACACCCWNYQNHCGCICSIIGHWLHNQVEASTWWDGRDNCIDGELSLEHTRSMSPRYAKYKWGGGQVGTVGWAGWGKKGGAGGGLRMAWGEILMLFLNPS